MPSKANYEQDETKPMRLICPNCSAQYEVDGSLIPEEGRDVQCSNCGHNWFELPTAEAATAPPETVAVDVPAPEAEPGEVGDAPVEDPEAPAEEAGEDHWADMPEAEAEDASEEAEAVESEPEVEAEAAEPVEAEPVETEAEPVEPEPEPAEPVEADVETASAEAEPEETKTEAATEEDWDWPQTKAAPLDVPGSDVPKPGRARRPAELAALEILKEEADRELAKRQGDFVDPIETQPDLALETHDDRETPSRALRARMARLRGEDEDDDPGSDERSDPDDAYSEPRKDLLPDIDEINSSLQPAGLGRGARSEAAEAEHRRGFRAGFVGMVAVAVGLILTYAQAPAIAGALPGTETALIGYVDWANGVRDWLSGLFGG